MIKGEYTLILGAYDGNAPMLPNVCIKSPYGKRVITLKKFTEQMLIERAVDGKYYV